MQNVLDVASLSPPQVTNATKSAISTTPAADQVSFDLILSMASSENVKQTDFSQNASQEKEYASTDVERVSNSISNSRNDEVQNRKEIEKKESEKPSMKKKTDEDDEIKEEAVAVMSNDQDVDNQSQFESNEDVIVETIDNSTILVNDSGNKNGLEVEFDQETKTLLSKQGLDNAAVTKNENILDSSFKEVNADEITKPVLIEEETTASMEKKTDLSIESEEDTLNVKNGIFSQEIDKTDKTDVDSINLEKNVKNQKAEASFTSETGSSKNVEKSNQQNLETRGNTEANDSATTAKDEKIDAKVSVKSDAAPPGSTITENVPTNATVSQVTQLSEPARLAEAPKTEVVTQISKEIDQMVKTNRSSLRVQLYPEELGHIDLKIVSTKDGIGVTMIADKASTQEVLKSEMNSLKQTIEQAGIQLNDLNVGQGQNSNQQQLYQENRNAAKTYSSLDSDIKNSGTVEKIVTLQTTVVDYKV